MNSSIRYGSTGLAVVLIFALGWKLGTAGHSSTDQGQSPSVTISPEPSPNTTLFDENSSANNTEPLDTNLINVDNSRPKTTEEFTNGISQLQEDARKQTEYNEEELPEHEKVEKQLQASTVTEPPSWFYEQGDVYADVTREDPSALVESVECVEDACKVKIRHYDSETQKSFARPFGSHVQGNEDNPETQTTATAISYIDENEDDHFSTIMYQYPEDEPDTTIMYVINNDEQEWEAARQSIFNPQ